MGQEGKSNERISGRREKREMWDNEAKRKRLDVPTAVELRRTESNR